MGMKSHVQGNQNVSYRSSNRHFESTGPSMSNLRYLISDIAAALLLGTHVHGFEGSTDSQLYRQNHIVGTYV